MKRPVPHYAPIALFAYRRPDHLARTIAALAGNDEAKHSPLYVFCDAARDEQSRADVARVKELADRIEGFASVEIVLRPSNYGLARNIMEGVTQVLDRHDRIVVVEDDVLVSPHFLRFMNDALSTYADEPRVGSVTGYCYPSDAALPETFFIRGADCWGWATWRDRWRSFDRDGPRLLRELDRRGLSHVFDFDGAMGYRAMLVDQIAGRNDSWAVRWHASCFLRGLLILYPGRSLVRNIGNDGTGTHAIEATAVYDGLFSAEPVPVERIPAVESRLGRDAFRRFFAPETSGPEEPQPSAEPLARPRRRWGAWLRDLLRASPIATAALPAHGVTSAGEVQPPPPRSYRGLNQLDRQIEKYLDFDGGFFVELGANDGLFQSNTWYYEAQRGWRGVLVEPAPNLFIECRRNRIPSTHVACAACVGFDYSEEFVRIVYSNAMSVSIGLETDLVDPLAHAELGRQFLREGETVFTFGALARPLNTILQDASAPLLIDFLSLDVEGAEVEVLKGIDHETYRFRFMLIECRDIERLQGYLALLGYELAERFNEHDYLFALKTADR
jgi:FkbM family methyltransferase